MNEAEHAALFWTQVAAIGQAAGAFVTAAAVPISLWIVLSERAIRLNCSVGLRIIAGSPGPSYDIVAFDITNTGQRSLRISSTGWCTGWKVPILHCFGWGWASYQHAMQITSTDIGSPQLPLDLAPRRRVTVFTDAVRFKEQNEAKRQDFVCRILPFLEKPVNAPLYGCVDIPSQKTRYFRAEKSLRQFCCTGELDDSVTKKLNSQH